MSEEELTDEERFSQLIKRRDEVYDIWRVEVRNWPSESDEHFLIRYSEALRDRIAELEKEPLGEIGIQEVCEWIVDTYPSDVFTGKSGGEGAVLVAEMRDRAMRILKFRKEAADAMRDEDK